MTRKQFEHGVAGLDGGRQFILDTYDDVARDNALRDEEPRDDAGGYVGDVLDETGFYLNGRRLTPKLKSLRSENVVPQELKRLLTYKP